MLLKSRLNFPPFLLEVLNFLLQVLNFLFCSAHCNWLTKIIHQWQRSEQSEVRKLKQEVRKFKMTFFKMKFLKWNILKWSFLKWSFLKWSFFWRICKKFFKFAKLMKEIPNELGSQKRNASRSLPVMVQNFLFNLKSRIPLLFYHVKHLYGALKLRTWSWTAKNNRNIKHN
jgi:hypothetical protein